jgi:hypothetical protein
MAALAVVVQEVLLLGLEQLVRAAMEELAELTLAVAVAVLVLAGVMVEHILAVMAGPEPQVQSLAHL